MGLLGAAVADLAKEIREIIDELGKREITLQFAPGTKIANVEVEGELTIRLREVSK